MPFQINLYTFLVFTFFGRVKVKY